MQEKLKEQILTGRRKPKGKICALKCNAPFERMELFLFKLNDVWKIDTILKIHLA